MKMDFYDSRYFIINKTFMMGFGLWPYQDSRIKFYIRTFASFALSAMLLPQLMALYKYFRLVDKVIEHLTIMLFISAMVLKFFTSIVAENKLKTVLDNIMKNWEKVTDEEEKIILIEYSEKGRRITVGYIIYITAALISFISLPVTPLVLNKLRPLNESRPQLFILNGEFMVDRDAHYGKIYLFDSLVCSVAAFIIVAVDTTYVVCVEHCLALFAIVKFRLKTLTKLIDRTDLKQKDDLIIQTVQLHNQIINFANVLESSYSTSFLFLMGINMLVFSTTSVLVLIKFNQIMEFIRFSMILVGMLVHLFYISWPGQKMIDHSGGLFVDTYSNEWYKSPIITQRLLKFVTLRCLKPCLMTAGGLYVMNFANFLHIVKTSISYITLFSSFR